MDQGGAEMVKDGTLGRRKTYLKVGALTGDENLTFLWNDSPFKMEVLAECCPDRVRIGESRKQYM